MPLNPPRAHYFKVLYFSASAVKVQTYINGVKKGDGGKNTEWGRGGGV
jgi:hypothetical protein